MIMKNYSSLVMHVLFKSLEVCFFLILKKKLKLIQQRKCIKGDVKNIYEVTKDSKIFSFLLIIESFKIIWVSKKILSSTTKLAF